MMKFLPRVLLCFVSLFCFPSAWSQSLPSPDEEAVRTLTSTHFRTLFAKDRAAYASLWFAQAPGLSAKLEGMKAFFANPDVMVMQRLDVQRIKIEGDKAWARVEVEYQVLNAQTREEKSRPILQRALEYAKADGQWKMWREETAAAPLARALIAAQTEAERASLLAAEPELVTAALVHELNVEGNRLPPAQAVAANQLAARLGEKIGDQLGTGRSLMNVAAFSRNQGNLKQALEALQQYLALVRKLDQKDLIAVTWRRIGELQRQQGDVVQAMASYRQSLDLFAALDRKDEMATILLDIGTLQRVQGDLVPAIASLQQSLSYYESLKNKLGKTRVLTQLAFTHRFLGELVPALEAGQQALTLAKELGNETEVAAALNALGRIHEQQGDFAAAVLHLQQSLAIRERLGLKAAVADTLLGLGSVEHTQSNFAQALTYYRKSLTLSEEIKDQFTVMHTLRSLGDVYLTQNNYATALTYFQKSLALSQAMRAQGVVAGTLNSIGLLHRLQGNDAQALGYYRQSLSIREALGDKAGVATAIGNLGGYYYTQRDHARALEHYTRSLEMWQAMGNKGGIATTLNNLSLVYAAQGDLEKALAHLQQAWDLEESLGAKAYQARLLGNLAATHEKLGHHTQALEFSKRAAARAQEIGVSDVIRNARYTAGLAHRALNQPAPARAAFAEAIALLETQRTQVAGGEEDQQRFFATHIKLYHAMMELQNTEGQALEALRQAERAKSRVLLDVLQHGRVNVSKALTASEREQERKLRAELTALNYQINLNANQPDADRLNALKERREKARLSYEAFQTTLYAAHPELQTQRGEAPIIKAEELLALLPDATSALLEFVVMEERTILFVVTKANAKADVQTFTLPIKSEALAQQIEAFRQQLAARDLGFRATATKLYDLLLKPAQAQLSGKTNLILVPDDKLWELPFQALVNHANRFLIEDATIAYAPSLTVLREMTKRRTPSVHAGATLLALGNPLLGQETIERAALTLRDGKLAPLPEAEQEVKALGQLYPRSKIYLGAEAREDRVKAEAASTRILHFATHGVLNNATPMYSHLLLTPGTTEEDGLLEAWELMQMDLQAELAVLSACETARGRYGAGEGMIGLS